MSAIRAQAARRSRLGAAASLSHPMFWPALALLAVYVVSYATFAGQLISFPFDLDQGEGYDAWSGWLINLGRLPYTSNAVFPYYSHGYPPVWSYVVSIPMAWTGPGLAPARAVSVLATLGVALIIGLAALRLSGTAWSGVLAAGIFLSSPYVFHTTPLARVNALMLLLDVLALWLLVRPTRRRVVAGALVLVAAVFTKPTAVDAVVAGLLYLLLVDLRRAALLAAVFGVVAGVGLVALQLASGGTYIANVLLSNSSAFDADQLWAYVQNFSLLHAIILLLAAANLVRAVRRRALTPWHIFALVAAMLALSTIGKTGAGESYFLGTIAAASILAAVEVDQLVSNAQARLGVGLAVAAALLVQGVLFAHGSVSEALAWLPDRGLQAGSLGHAPTAADRAAADELAALVRKAPGPVLAEDASVAVVGGKELVGTSPPSLRNLWEAHLWDPAPLVADLRAHRYSMVILDAQLYPPPVLDAIGQAYFQERTVRVDGAVYRVFLPGSA